MLREGVEWFGETTPNVVVSVNLCTTTSAPPTTLFGLPDLSVDDIYLVDEFGNRRPDPTGVGSDVSGNLFYSIKNIGGLAAIATQSSVAWLDSGQNPGGNSVDDVVGLPASTSSQEWLGLHNCPTPGSFFYWKICADSSNVVGEATKSNNCHQERWWCPGSLSTTTTTTSSSTSSTTTTLYTRTVTLKYKVTDADEPGMKFNCSIWTNVSGYWSVNRTTLGVKSSETNNVFLLGVPAGMYGWTVNCSDGAHNVYPTAANAPRDTPNGYWIFYVKA
jgi:hypothetical protein